MGSRIAISEKRVPSILSVHKYFRIIYYLSTAIGIFPFFLQGRHNNTSYPVVILSIIAVISIGYCSIFVNYSLFYVLPIDEKLFIKMEIILIACVLTTHSILFLISAGTSLWRVRAVRQIMQALEEVDAMINKRSRKEYDFQDFLCFLLNASLIAWHAAIHSDLTFMFFFIIITLNFWLTTSQFSVLARLISIRLQNACEALQELKKTIHLPRQKEKTGMLSKAHGKLCDACEVLQSAFGFLITVVTVINFLGLIAVTFYLYNCPNLKMMLDIKLFFSTGPDRPPVDHVFWMIYIMAISWIISASSSELKEKTKEFNHLLYHLMINDKSSELLRNEKLLLHLSMKREVVLTACGLFNLDFSLLHSMVAAAATYLIMLIQFDQD